MTCWWRHVNGARGKDTCNGINKKNSFMENTRVQTYLKLDVKIAVLISTFQDVQGLPYESHRNAGRLGGSDSSHCSRRMMAHRKTRNNISNKHQYMYTGWHTSFSRYQCAFPHKSSDSLRDVQSLEIFDGDCRKVKNQICFPAARLYWISALTV